MPANARSLQLTDTYRQRKVAIVDRVQREARESWPTIDTLDGTKWAEVMASKLTRAQTEGIRLTAGYLTAYTASETGQRGRTAPISTRPYAGVSRDGRPLREALRSPLIGTLAALKDNPPDKALSIGLARALRMVGFEASQAPRDALLDTIESDDRFSGWNRAVAGTCAACMALSGTTGPHFEVHPGCQCEPEPFVAREPVSFTTLPDQFGLTPGQRSTLELYRRAGSFSVNNVLRGKASELGDLTETQVAKIDSLIGDIDEAFAAVAPVKEPVKVWRGSPRVEETFGGLVDGDDLVGKVLTDDAFGSTTGARETAEGFLRFNDNSDLLDITLDPGVKAIRFADDAHVGEKEVLLNRGSRYLITGVRHENGQRVLEVTVKP